MMFELQHQIISEAKTALNIVSDFKKYDSKLAESREVEEH